MPSPFAKAALLVVEDDPILRISAIDIAEEAGFEVLEAANADEAIAILGKRDDIRIVFTDIDMPGSMDGLRLAHFVRKRWPPVQFIVTSGHVQVLESDLPEGSVFFPKPYDAERVTAVMHRLAA